MGRAPCCDKANVKRGPWSPEEDSKLKEYIEKHGTGGNWIALPQKAGLKRCGKSCRLRWLNYLRPNIKHGEFSDEEDRVICSLYANIGSRWSIIAAQLPGRTDNDIKNYWNTKLKKKLMALLPPSTTTAVTTTHPQRKSPSSPQNLPTLIPSLPPYTDHHHHYYSSYYYSPPPPATISFSGLEPISVHSTTSLPSLYQNQEHLMSSAVISPMQLQYFHNNSMRDNNNNNNVFMFGSSDQGSCSSSDGSCSQGCRESLMGCQGSSSDNGEYGINQWTEEKPNGCFYQTPTATATATTMDYELEVIKQLISSSTCTNNSNIIIDHDGYSAAAVSSSVDENKMGLGMYNIYY